MLSVENEATPFDAVTVLVPESVPPLGFVPIATVTLPLNDVTVLPRPSSAVTVTAGVMVGLAVVIVGWTENPTCAAAPGAMLNAALAAAAGPVALAASV